MAIKLEKPALQNVIYPSWSKKEISVSVLREDLTHPYISGNKGRKLKYNLVDFKNSGKKTIVTFGGAFSNHLVAVAAASKEYDFSSIAVVRGEEISNPYLNFMSACGMKLHFISRTEYRNKGEEAVVKKIVEELLIKKWINIADEIFIIPEGGANMAAVKGASEIMEEIPSDVEFIACACGTGTTAAGISQRLYEDQTLLAVSVLKAPGYIEESIEKLGGDFSRVIIIEDYHFGGYAKENKLLLDFCEGFTMKTQIPVEPVYTGKLFFAIDDLIRNDYFKTGTKVTLIHTGGIYDFMAGL